MRKAIILIALLLLPGLSYGEGLRHEPYIGGYPNGMFKPNGHITRAEVAKIMVDSMGSETFRGESFPDIDLEHWASPYIYTAKLKGYIGGYEDGSYKPNMNITRAEFASIVYRTVKEYIPEDLKNDSEYALSDIENHWAASYINVLNKLGVVSGYEDGKYKPKGLITRAEAVSIVNKIQGRIPDREKIDGMRKSVYRDKSLETHWGYYDIIEASVYHDFYIVAEGGKQREFWTRLYF